LPNEVVFKKDGKSEFMESFWASPDGDKLITIGFRCDFIEKEKGDGKANNQE